MKAAETPDTPDTADDARRRHAADFLRLRHLRLLELVQHGGSLAAAARELHLSQPAVTKMLQELEATFGTSLVARGARGGTLTPAGSAALQRLRLARLQVEAALAGADGPAALPMLRLGVLPLVGVTLLPAALRRLADTGLPLRVELHESTVGGLMSALLDGRVDCIIGRAGVGALARTGAGDAARIVRVPLLEERLVVACAKQHALARARRLDLPRLQAQEWVLAPAGSQTRRVFDTLFLDHGLTPPRPRVESMSFHTNLHLVAALNALTVAPLSAIEVHASLDLVRVLKAAPALPPGILTVMHLDGHEALPALGPFIAAMQAAAGS